MTKLFVATPCYGGQCLEAYAASIIALSEECRVRGIQLSMDTTENESLIPRARNIALGRFMQKTDSDYLLFIDADIHFSAKSVMRLIDSGHEFSCAAYPKKVIMWDLLEKAVKEGDAREPSMLTSSLVMNFKESRSRVVDGFVEVLDGPTGFMLIKRSVIEKMQEKYPELNCKNDHQGRDFDDYCALFDCMIDPDNKRYLSEDYAFCRRWQAIGGQIYADTTTTLGHVGNLGFPARLKDRVVNTTNKNVSSGGGNKK
jgi:hypothetical protein